MLTNKYFFSLLATLLLLMACEDEMSEPEIENPMIFTLDINDITPTDESGALLGNSDNTDWTLNDDWPDVIKGLFESYDSLDHTCIAPTDLTIYPAYPNPGNGLFSISMQKPTGSKVEFQLVNQYATSLNEFKNITSNNFTVDASQFVPSQDSFLRVYYLLSTADNCAYRGHGDIQLR